MNNTGNIDMYLNHPRKATTINLDKHVNNMNNHTTERETRMIENSLEEAKQKYNYKKERQQQLRKSIYGAKHEKTNKGPVKIEESLEINDKQKEIMKKLKDKLKQACVRKPV